MSFRKLQVSGFYRDVEIEGGDEPEYSELDETKESPVLVWKKQASSDEIVLYECHCYLDLDRFSGYR